MAQKQKKGAKAPRPKKKKADMRRVLVGTVAIALVLVFLLPILAQIAGGAGAVTQSEIDALIADQKASQQRQEELESQLAAIEDEQAAAAGESSRSLSTVQRGSQVLGRLVPHGQLWQVTEGGGVERGDLSVPHLYRRLGELLQKALFFRHPDPPLRSKTGAALPQ